MLVAVFGTKKYDREHFLVANSQHHHDLQFLEPPLSAMTVSLAREVPCVCVFVNDHVDRPVIEELANHGTRLIALRCAGYNNIDLKAAKEHDMTIVRVPAYSPHAVAEHAVALILTLNRKTHRAFNRVREGNFSLEGLIGFDLHGKTVGVVGTGKIGAIFCRIMAGFGCRVLANDIRENPEAIAVGAEYVSRQQLFAESDIISLHCPLTSETHYLINEAAIQTMKPEVMIVNTGRGALINATAAVHALKANRIGSLAMDVYEEEERVFFEDQSARGLRDDVLARLLSFPNVLITGHQAFLTHEALHNIAETTLANIAQFERGEPCSNQVELS
jgi:D-lactate dehydrogenase